MNCGGIESTIFDTLRSMAEDCFDEEDDKSMRHIAEYVVVAGYRKFRFTDGEAALNFARTAAMTMEPEQYSKTVLIEIVPEEASE